MQGEHEGRAPPPPPRKNVTSGKVPRGQLPPDHKGAPEGGLEVTAAEGIGALDEAETLSATLTQLPSGSEVNMTTH